MNTFKLMYDRGWLQKKKRKITLKIATLVRLADWQKMVFLNRVSG